MKNDPLTTFGAAIGSPEIELLGRIKSSETPEDRERLLTQLEDTPVTIHPYHSRWLILHEIGPFHCWTDAGYDPSYSDVPRDIQLLAAASYGVSDIENGGFHQFFSNSTGVFAPEMAEWFSRSSLPEAARIMRKAIAIFGDEFPRSQSVRQEHLKAHSGGKRDEWDPFRKLDEPFYDAVSGTGLANSKSKFNDAADKWLRDVCGIRDLRTKYHPERAIPSKAAEP